MQGFTIEEFENSMTLYYFKRDGSIHSWCTGINNLSTFGNHKEDYELILDYLILPIDRYVLDNIKYFNVDIETKKLCFNTPTINYTIR
jgi:hypothetical protein